jgi:UDP-3-O-[3-hydroxymyristoyl] N-acetylglucosamine deacetylase/3-hydroxyacyl-[acyl-carrier-protein] dehydratase
MNELQRTISKPVSIFGAGLHTGKKVTLTFHPAPVDHGIKFKRIDLSKQPVIDADVDNVVDISRGTTLEQHGARILTVEHTLAAITGLRIDNLLIEIDCAESPILDGSSKYYTEALLSAGIVEQEALRKYYTIDKVITFSDPANKIELVAIPSDHFRLSVMIDYDSNVLGTQYAILDRIEDFTTEIANCRTFVFLHELEYLIQNNLIRGGDVSNAIVFVDKIISQEELDRLAAFFNKPRVTVLKEGILNNVNLHFPNEPARHKLLDVIGDLTLVGKPIKGHIIAKRPGHSANAQFAKMIKNHFRALAKRDKAPFVDTNQPPLYDIIQIQNILPHRPPFLLVDRIIEMTESSVLAVKNVTMNESFFVGHFPDEPVMPGVLQVEAMAQSGGILALSSVPDPKEYIAYFLKIENAKFRHKVVPGDTLIFKLELASPIRRGICHMKGYAYVGDRIVTEAELFAQLVKKKKEE